MDHEHMGDDLAKVLLTEEQIQARLAELAADIWRDYEGKDFLLVGVLKGAVVVMADLMRALPGTAPMDWMAVSSYGSGTKSSGVVRILKDLDTDITRPPRAHRRGHHRLRPDALVDQVQPRVAQARPRSRSARCCASPTSSRSTSRCKYVGFDIPNEFVVGYGLDYAEKYRNLRCVGTLAPHVYA